MRTAADILRTQVAVPTPVLGPYIRADGLNLLVGPEGAGKSCLLAQIAVAVASGCCPRWATSVRQGNVLWLTGEETEAVVARGLERAAMSLDVDVPSNVLKCVTVSDAARDGLDQLLRGVRACDPVLLIADPVDVLAPPKTEPRRALDPLLRDIRARGYAVVAVIHTLHGARAADKVVKGAGDWTRVARSVVYYGPDPRHDPLESSQTSILYHLKTNRGGDCGAAQLFSHADGWLGSIPKLALQELLERPERRPAACRPIVRAIELLVLVLTDGPRRVSDMLAWGEKEGISRATMYRAGKTIGVHSSGRTRANGRFADDTWWSLNPGEDTDDSAREGDPSRGGDSTRSHNGVDDVRRGAYPDPNSLRGLPEEDQRIALLEALGLAAGSRPELMTQKWRELMKKHHPDHGGDPVVAARLNAIFRRLQELSEEVASEA